MYDYFYGPEGEQFSFIRVPKLFFENEAYRSMSAEAKILYGVLLDRVSVSQQMWPSAFILIVMEVSIIMITFGAGLLEGILQIAQESLGIFMRS